MIVYQFTVPANKNYAAFEEKIAREFGGGFVTFSDGLWRNLDGRVERERVAVYTVAVDSLTEGFRLRGTVRDFLKEISEQAMYFAEIGTAQIEFLSGNVPALAKE